MTSAKKKDYSGNLQMIDGVIFMIILSASYTLIYSETASHDNDNMNDMEMCSSLLHVILMSDTKCFSNGLSDKIQKLTVSDILAEGDNKIIEEIMPGINATINKLVLDYHYALEIKNDDKVISRIIDIPYNSHEEKIVKSTDVNQNTSVSLALWKNSV